MADRARDDVPFGAVAGPKDEAKDPAPVVRPTAQATAVLPGVPRRPTPRPPGGVLAPRAMATEVVPGGHGFAKRDPRSETGRKKGDSAQPLDFTKVGQIGRFGLI